MEENRPLVSVVVPTKNRYPYLEKLIELIDSFKYGNELELVIQDNNIDNSSFLKFLEKKIYPNVKYFFDPKSMSIGQNSDIAINHSTGEYICFIGDDDCVTRNLLPCIKWMQKNDVECVFPRRIMYFWPDYCDKGDEREAVHYEPFSHDITFYNTSEVLMEALYSGCVSIARLPMIYHGIVKRNVLNKIWSQCGTLFPGASPDIASGISLCMVVDKYASFKFPIVIAGNSRTGGGGQKILKHHAQADFSKLPFLPKNITEIWCKRIPKIWSNSTVWCESVVEALYAWKREDLAEKINFEKLYENFVINYFHYRKMAFKLTDNKFKLFFNSIIEICKSIAKTVIKKILGILHVHLNNIRVKVFNIRSTEELCNYLEKKGYIFDKYFKNN